MAASNHRLVDAFGHSWQGLASVDLEPSPVFHDRLALFSRELVDGRILVDRIVVVMGCGDFLHDAPALGTELMPSAWQDDCSIAGPQQALLAIYRQVHLPPQRLESLLLKAVKVIGMRLSGQLDED